jgi:hypothetical protein
VGGRRPAIPGQEMVTGRVLEHWWAEASKMRAKKGEEVGRRGGAHRAEISGELGHASASNAHRRGPYHRKLVQARAARGRGGAQRKMETPVVHCGGRNGQRRRARVRAVAEESRSACYAAAME